MVYLDSSAILTSGRAEAGTEALREWLTVRHDQPLVTGEVGRVEVLLVSRWVGARAEAEARMLLGDLDLVSLDRAVQDLPADLGSSSLRTSDTLHLASAVRLGEHLTALVVYDHRLASAAESQGLDVAASGYP